MGGVHASRTCRPDTPLEWLAEKTRAICAKPMTAVRPLVSVVDDDESVRESLPDLLNEFGYSVRTFSSAQEFLQSDALDRTAVLHSRHCHARDDRDRVAGGVEADAVIGFRSSSSPRTGTKRFAPE